MGFASIINSAARRRRARTSKQKPLPRKPPTFATTTSPLIVPNRSRGRLINSGRDHARGSQPAFITVRTAGRAATMWLIKRLVVANWEDRTASREATALGLRIRRSSNRNRLCAKRTSDRSSRQGDAASDQSMKPLHASVPFVLPELHAR